MLIQKKIIIFFTLSTFEDIVNQSWLDHRKGLDTLKIKETLVSDLELNRSDQVMTHKEVVYSHCPPTRTDNIIHRFVWTLQNNFPKFQSFLSIKNIFLTVELFYRCIWTIKWILSKLWGIYLALQIDQSHIVLLPY